MLTCEDIAIYFLTRSDDDAGDNISNMKLQKLMYYAQGFHLAMHNAPLFREPIEAWTHGPVVARLYHKYKQYEAGAIPVPETVDFDKYPPHVKELLDEVYNVYGQFSAWKLRNMTHEDPPWKNTLTGGTISHTALREHFADLLTNE